MRIPSPVRISSAVRVGASVLPAPPRLPFASVLPAPPRLPFVGRAAPVPTADARPAARPLPPAGDGPPLGLGPGSLTWRLFGETYMALTAGSVGVLQTMHPGIGQSLQDHSNFFEDPLDRIRRSVPHIMRVVYADPFAPPGPTAQGELVRGFHGGIHGTDNRGRDYDALDGETFLWAHLTFVYGIVAGRERLGVPLTEEELDQLHAETLLWFRRYGADESAVPEDRAAMQAWWDHMVEDVLERNATSQGILDAARDGVPSPIPAVPEAVWRLVQRPLLGAWLWVGVGALPEAARETLGVPWTPRDEALLGVLRTGIRGVNALLPPVLRYHPIAYRAMRDVARAHGVPFRWAVDGPV